MKLGIVNAAAAAANYSAPKSVRRSTLMDPGVVDFVAADSACATAAVDVGTRLKALAASGFDGHVELDHPALSQPLRIPALLLSYLGMVCKLAGSPGGVCSYRHDGYMTKAQVMARLGISRKTLYRWDQGGLLEPVDRRQKPYRYRIEDVMKLDLASE